MNKDAPIEIGVARDLVTPNRFDVCAKHAYARLREIAPALRWGRLVYEKHILALNQAVEGDGEKIGIDRFFASFDAVLDSIKSRGFDNSQSAVPIDGRFVLAGGAHRAAACLLYGANPVISRVPCADFRLTWGFFAKRGLEQDVLDYMALEYCRLRDDCLLAVVYPCAVAQIEAIESILAEKCKIVCRKKILATGRYAPQNIIRQIYPNASWLGRAKDGFKGASEKARVCFAGPRYFYALLLQAESLADAAATKEKARAKAGLSNHSLHITDDHTETVAIARMFFNANSIFFFNHATPINSPVFHERLIEYAAAVGAREDFAVHGSAVMEAFGIREADDLDYLSRGSEALQTADSKISLGNEKAEHGDYSLDELLFDPRRYFYFYGVKFVDLPLVERMKVLRGDKKDARDVALIKSWRRFDAWWKLHQAAQRMRGIFPKYKRRMLRRKIKNWLRAKSTAAID